MIYYDGLGLFGPPLATDTYQYTETVDLCAQFCLATPTCEAFTWVSKESAGHTGDLKTCYLRGHDDHMLRDYGKNVLGRISGFRCDFTKKPILPETYQQLGKYPSSSKYDYVGSKK